MGRDKTLLKIKGKSLLEHWVQRAKPVFNEIVLLSGSNRYNTSTRQLKDELQDAGPLSGLLAAMRDPKNKDDYLAVIAIDLPNLQDSTLQKLAADTPEKSQSLIASCGNQRQPLAGIYHRKLSDELTQYLKTDRRSVMGFIREINSEYFFVDEEELLNVNQPEAWRVFTKQYRSDSTSPTS